jgi:hypothetical protein
MANWRLTDIFRIVVAALVTVEPALFHTTLRQEDPDKLDKNFDTFNIIFALKFEKVRQLVKEITHFAPNSPGLF